MTLPGNDYQTLLNGLKEKIRQARVKAIRSVNYYLIQVYWEIGNTIAQQQQAEGWGAKTVDNLSRDLKAEFTDMKGLSPRNLRYMRDFATAWPHFPFSQEPLAKLTDESILQPPAAELGATKSLKTKNEILQPQAAKSGSTFYDQFVQPLLAQIPWTHHTIILDRVKTTEERFFYIQKTIENGWSKNVLSLQMESGLYKRQGKAITNFTQTLPAYDSDLAVQTFKSPYVLEFLTLAESAKERDIEKGLIEHLKKFMLELGRGFAYVGNQYNLNVQGDDYFLDLLFYNYHLHCFVVFELKVSEFKPEFAGKLNFYINTINQQIKGTDDKPTIGILLCKTPNDTVVKYSLQGIGTPIGVADYKLKVALPKELKGEMPSVQELEKALESKIDFEKQLEKLKPLIGNYRMGKRNTGKASKKQNNKLENDL
ncbi:MAG: PDDEXK nuclease domain-containing protein [Ginsengibacter sp.]